jgi:hypothetical protein
MYEVYVVRYIGIVCFPYILQYAIKRQGSSCSINLRFLFDKTWASLDATAYLIEVYIVL